MKKRVLWVGISVVLAATVVFGLAAYQRFCEPSAFAFSPSDGLAGPGQWFLEEATDRLDLTEAQQEMLTGYLREFREKRQELAGVHDAFRSRLMEELRAEAASAENLNRIFSEGLDQMKQQAGILAERIAAFQQTLSPEQREKLVTEMERHHRFHRRMHRWW